MNDNKNDNRTGLPDSFPHSPKNKAREQDIHESMPAELQTEYFDSPRPLFQTSSSFSKLASNEFENASASSSPSLTQMRAEKFGTEVGASALMAGFQKSAKNFGHPHHPHGLATRLDGGPNNATEGGVDARADARTSTGFRKLLDDNDSWPAISIWEGGAVSGIFSGLVLGLVMMTFYWFHGEGFTFPLKLMAASFLGVEALLGGSWPVVLGLTIHLFASAALGVLFAFLTQKVFSVETSLSVGILFGFAVWMGLSYVILPWLDPVMKARADIASGWWFGCFMLYGMSLVLTPYFELRTAPRRFLDIARRRILSESY